MSMIRHSQRKPRDKADIGIHSIRGGTIVGEHDVIFAGQHEVITLSHRAESRDIFALGALNAAKFLSRQGVGLYSMPDLLK
jgi:4-hydroxy-tetrahydrodipicolinate reductase